MKQNNIEHQAKFLLEQRTMNPTPQAWDRLESMLAQVEQTKGTKKRRMVWLAYAASLVGILVVVMAAYFFSKNQQTEAPVLVKESNQPKTENTMPTITPETPAKKADENREFIAKSPMSKPSPKADKPQQKVEKISTEQPVQATLIAQQTNSSPKAEVETIATTEVTKSVAATPVEVVLNVTKVTAFKPKIKVNSEQLLTAANEDPATFRTRVFKVLSNTSTHIVTYIQDRNTAE